MTYSNAAAPSQGPSNILGIKAKSSGGAGTGGGSFKRYRLKTKAASILYSREKSPKEQHRTCWCHRGMVRNSNLASVYRQADGSSARFGGLVTCGSVWACPICSHAIANERQRELEAGSIAWHGTDKANRIYLLTLTFPHERGMPLAELLQKFSKALVRFKSCEAYKRIMAKHRRAGSVRSMEVTLGKHGWHPHTHDLVFAKPGLFEGIKEIETTDFYGNQKTKLLHPDIDRLKRAWFEALIKADLCEMSQAAEVLEHGLDVQGGDYAAAYIAKFGREQKWGLSREVTLHVAKMGSDLKGAHPFQLLEWAENGDGLACDQFREYAEAFEGKRMVTWSPGLKKLLNISEITDEQAAESKLPDEQRIGSITEEQLSILISRQLMPKFLRYVRDSCIDPDNGQEDIDDWFEVQKKKKRRSQGVIRSKLSKGFAHYDAEFPYHNAA